MGAPFRLACIQVNSGNEILENINAASVLVRAAAEDGAVFISLPECVALLEPDPKALFGKSFKDLTEETVKNFLVDSRLSKFKI